MPYAVRTQPAVERQLAGIPRPDRDELRAAIRALADSPRPTPPLGTKLEGKPARYRLRVRQYRVIYRIDPKAREVVVTWVGLRRDAHRG